MNALLVAGLILGIGAPAPKEAPKKASESKLEGLWEISKFTVAGAVNTDGASRLEFAADGTFTFHWVKQKFAKQYKSNADSSKSPAELDWWLGSDEKKFLRGIYKIDGDILTVCFEDGFDSKRPTKFESLKGTKTMIWTLKRVEKKKE